MSKELEIVNKVLAEARMKNWVVIAIQPFDHPDDAYMVKCAVMNDKGEYVSYIFNRGFQSGTYFNDPLKAIAHIKER